MKNNKEKGMSILEAIVASVIVGIGFIGIFQMVGYAVNLLMFQERGQKLDI